MQNDETAALAAAQPVADAEVERLARHLTGIADASRRDDGSDIPLGEQCREAATLIRCLHARAVRAEAERDEARALLAEAKEALRPFAACVGSYITEHEPDSYRAVGEVFNRDFRRASATLARLDAATPETRHD